MAHAPEAVVSHWSTLIEDFNTSPLGFYTAVEAALVRRQIPDTKKSRVDFKEAGLLSADREYLRVTREKLTFDVCGAPFGTGFFVSWWLSEPLPKLNPLVKAFIVLAMLTIFGWMMFNVGFIWGPVWFFMLLVGGLAVVNTMTSGGDFDDGFIRALPIIGSLYVWLFKQDTYYRIDTTEMFQKAVHNAVLEVIDKMTSDKGFRALSEADRKPIMRDFYGRKGQQ